MQGNSSNRRGEGQNVRRSSKTKSRRPKRSFLLILGLILIIGSFTITIISKQLETREKKAELAAKQAQLQQIEDENNYKQSVVDNDDKSSYLEKEAREQGFVFPNEKLFYDANT